ncbi:hypothetical protein PENTCL1PPCAC_8962, partial [Pristionchus entomophagus]
TTGYIIIATVERRMWGGTASERKDGGPSGLAGAKVGTAAREDESHLFLGGQRHAMLGHYGKHGLYRTRNGFDGFGGLGKDGLGGRDGPNGTRPIVLWKGDTARKRRFGQIRDLLFSLNCIF